MSALSIQPAYPIFTDIDGQPLEAGYIWIGAANLDPQVNPINIYWDEALTILAPQPLRTVGGYIVNSGTPAKVYVNAASYSIRVMNKNGSTIYTLANGTGISPNANGVVYNPNTPNSIDVTVAQMFDPVLTPMSYGAVGDGVTDDTAAIVRLLTDVADGQTIDLMGRAYALFVGNNGVTVGDALPLADVPHLSGRNNITIRNGTLFAANPGVSGVKVRYPSTLSFIGCTNMKLENVTLRSRGENYGDSDAGAPLGPLDRAIFSIQNGGHAFLFTRSTGLTAINCNFELCGSTGACYVQSSDNAVFGDCYSTAESLGYNAWCCDNWAGSPVSLGFPGFNTALNNCRSDNNGATYGTKGCVLADGAGVNVQVNGGVWKDAWANGSAQSIGFAFGATSGFLYARGAYVENCASIGYSSSNTLAPTALECIGVKAKNLGTTMHSQDLISFGGTVVRYEACDAEILGNRLWPAIPELSVATVVANRKVTSEFVCEIIGCQTSGAHTFSVNTNACYGGISVLGGQHTVTDRIFDSSGWGGSGVGTRRGFVISGAKMNVLLVNTAVVSNAITNPATTAIVAIQNRDSSLRFTTLFVDFDESTQVQSNLYREFATVINWGAPGILERRVLAQVLNDCFQSGYTAGFPRTTKVKVISQDGIAGPNVKVTFALLDQRVPGAGRIVGDDLYAVRGLLSSYTSATAVGTELHQGWFVNGAAYDLTIGNVYNLVTQD